jgi:hypothetical protein
VARAALCLLAALGFAAKVFSGRSGGRSFRFLLCGSALLTLRARAAGVAAGKSFHRPHHFAQMQNAERR